MFIRGLFFSSVDRFIALTKHHLNSNSVSSFKLVTPRSRHSSTLRYLFGRADRDGSIASLDHSFRNLCNRYTLLNKKLYITQGFSYIFYCFFCFNILAAKYKHIYFHIRDKYLVVFYEVYKSIHIQRQTLFTFSLP